MNEEQTALCSKLTRLSAIFALVLPLAAPLIGNALVANGDGNQYTVVLSYVSAASTAFSGTLIYFGARRLSFRQGYVIAVFPVAANVLMTVSALNVLQANSGAAGLPSAYICAAYLRITVLPFLVYWLCELWSKPLKNEALFAAVSIFADYVLSSLTNWMVGGLLPTGSDTHFVRTDPISFGRLFWLDMLVEVCGYALLWLLFRKKCKPQPPEKADQ